MNAYKAKDWSGATAASRLEEARMRFLPAV
jgi:hypothetical protein